jgi:large subunit ribosomal protein L21e
MPHKGYHGRTGVVWNVTKRAVGVEVNKQVGNRVIAKRIHVRIEHVVPSRCKEEFLTRTQANDEAKRAAKAAGQPLPKTKRLPAGPRAGFSLANAQPLTITAIPYDIVKDAKI